jgi:CRISPR-associated endonuclease/helicase Cas3
MNVNLTFWAKTASSKRTLDSQERSSPNYKPVLHHLLDVGAVALRFLSENPARLRREAALLGLEPEGYARLMAFFAGLHDLGKLSRPFQWKVPELWPDVLGPRPEKPPAGPNHWRMTAWRLRRPPLESRFRAYLPRLAKGYEWPIVAAIAGHHGAPPPPDDPSWTPDDPICASAAEEAFELMEELLRPALAEDLDEDGVCLLSWRLSGLTTLADWVGSDAEFFPLAPLDIPLSDYWRNALKAAEQALAAKGLLPTKPAAAVRLADFAPQAAAFPRPMQAIAGSLALSAGPQLLLIEDATGSGKTEAAILLAARLMVAGHGEGIFFALPTMATANAMHDRLRAVVDAIFEQEGTEGRRPSLVLAHAKADLSRELARLAAAPLADGEPSAAADCNAWISDDRRRAFFADVGAGTIDQAFLAVLPKKHLTLRQYALAGRILIIDEAHCFDFYMKEELNALLRLYAMNGGSAIVLSATLSLEARREIAEAFLLGLGLQKRRAKRDAGSLGSLSYPLLTQADATGGWETSVALAQGLARTVNVERLPNRSAAHEAACAAADVGAAVLVISNAVDEAIAAFDRLATVRPEGTVHLFHARFAQCDRLAIENDVLGRFGRAARPKDRAGHILVATQVVEQSLDLDFDLVISDLAPIDLIIQRAGRLWRHMDQRPQAVRPTPEPMLMVVSPDPGAVDAADWLGSCLGKAAAVYQNAGILWRSARTLFAQGRIRTPDDLRPMIEAVYGADGAPVPRALGAAEQKGVGKEGAARALGTMNVISLPEGYGALPSDLRADEDIGTRLGEPTITLRLARRIDGRLVPWDRTPGASSSVAWALSEVKGRRKFWGDALPLAEDEALCEAARRDWPEWDKAIEIVEVADDGCLRVRNADMNYDPKFGLRKL